MESFSFQASDNVRTSFILLILRRFFNQLCSAVCGQRFSCLLAASRQLFRASGGVEIKLFRASNSSHTDDRARMMACKVFQLKTAIKKI